MKIKQFLKMNRIKAVDFATALDTTRAHLNGITQGLHRPNLVTIRKIELLTEGQVTMEDFLTEKELNPKLNYFNLLTIKIL